MIDFHPVNLHDKADYEQHLFMYDERGCEFSFANRYLWGKQEVALFDAHIVIRLWHGNQCSYSYLLGNDNQRNVLDAIIADAEEQGMELRIIGLDQSSMHVLEHYYPGKFHFHNDRDFYDYIYDINDLADLKGKRYNRKRNHFNRFKILYPDYEVQPISSNNFLAVKEMIAEWFENKQRENPGINYHHEQTALR